MVGKEGMEGKEIDGGRKVAEERMWKWEEVEVEGRCGIKGVCLPRAPCQFAGGVSHGSLGKEIDGRRRKWN